MADIVYDCNDKFMQRPSQLVIQAPLPPRLEMNGHPPLLVHSFQDVAGTILLLKASPYTSGNAREKMLPGGGG